MEIIEAELTALAGRVLLAALCVPPQPAVCARSEREV